CTRLPLAPLWIGAIAVGMESIRSNFPLNGFPWGRLAFTQPSGALLPLASVGGAPLITFAVVLIGVGLAQCAHRLRTPHALVAPAAAVLVPIVAGLALMPTINSAPPVGSRTVGLVQGGGPNIGVRLLDEPNVLWRTHLAEARVLAARIAAGKVAKPDMVFFPESTVDLPGATPRDAEAVGFLARLLGVPVAVGTRELPSNGPAQNVVVAWRPGPGPLGGTELGSYAKQELVPYAEYVPLKSVAKLFTPFLDQASNMKPGDQPGVITIAGAKVGFAICYEVAYDRISRQAVDAGAQLLVVPTNNAWFGRTEMTYQQLAMARVRAVEHDRAVVVAASTGVSAVVRPDGSVESPTSLFAPATVVASVPLKGDHTVADKLGPSTERAFDLVGLLGVVLGFGARRSMRRRAAVPGLASSGAPGSSTAVTPEPEGEHDR
ncbi:MAG: apolipoprotein N-acyltransferase, partial [Sciscionella sp.]